MHTGELATANNFERNCDPWSNA